MKKCLNKNELHRFIEMCTSPFELDDGTDLLLLAIEGAKSWEYEIFLLTYFFSNILEVQLKKGIDCSSLINLAYSLQDQMWITMQEFDYRFIEYMLHSERIESLTLEERLIELQVDLEEHKYGKKFRN